jgi:hypothetical protein
MNDTLLLAIKLAPNQNWDFVINNLKFSLLTSKSYNFALDVENLKYQLNPPNLGCLSIFPKG